MLGCAYHVVVEIVDLDHDDAGDGPAMLLEGLEAFQVDHP